MSNRKNVEAEKKVFPEFSPGHQIGEVFVGGGDDADIDGNRSIGSDTLDGAFGEGSEEFHLGSGVNFADFVEEERSAVCLLESPDASLRGAGEGAFFVAEELAFEELGREGRAVDRDKFFARTAGEIV